MHTAAAFIKRHWRVRPLCFCACAFLTGCIIASWLSMHAWKAWKPALLLLALLIVLAALLRKHHKKTGPFLLVCFMLLGALRYDLEGLLLPVVTPSFSSEFEGLVINDPYVNQAGDRLLCDLRVTRLNGRAYDHTVRLYLRSEDRPLSGIAFGNKLHCNGHIWPASAATNPFQYDNQRALLANGITGMAACKLEDVFIAQEKAASLPETLRHDIASGLADRIDLLFPKNAGVVRALILGDRSVLDNETAEIYRSTGIIHLICISGMHISVLALFLEGILSRFLPLRSSRIVTIVFLLFYGALIGFPVSFLRALIMYTISTLSLITGRPSDPITRICLALFAVLLWKPYQLNSAGFALSFLSVAGIILLQPTLGETCCISKLKERRRTTASKLKKLLYRGCIYLVGSFTTSLAVQLSTFPAVITWFGGQKLITILVNMAAIPLMTIAYPFALFACLCSWIFFPVGALAANAADGLLSLIKGLAQRIGAISSFTLTSPRYPLLLLIVHGILILCSSSLSRFSKIKQRLIPVFLVFVTLLSIAWARISAYPFQAVFFDAGQADAMLIKADGKVFAFDIGDVYTPMDDYIGASCVSLDAVFLTHPHYDHAGALKQLIETRSPAVIYVPRGWFEVEYTDTIHQGIDLALERDIPIVELSAGDHVQLSAYTSVDVYSPFELPDDVNDMSLLLEVKSRGRSILITGDLTAKGEPDVIPDIDILKVPHHGSRSGTSDHMAEETSPEIAIISVGENNYGHPSDETISRLEGTGAEIYRTDQCGAITLWIAHNGDIHTYTYLNQEAPYELE